MTASELHEQAELAQEAHETLCEHLGWLAPNNATAARLKSLICNDEVEESLGDVIEDYE